MDVELLDRPGIEGVNKRLHDLVEDTKKAASKAGGATVEERIALDARAQEISAMLSLHAQPRRLYLSQPLQPPGHTSRAFYNLVQLHRSEVGWSMHPTLRALQQDVQITNDRLLWADLLMCGNGQTKYAQLSPDPGVRMRSLRMWTEDWEPMVADLKRALGTGSAGTGGAWVPSMMSARLTDNIAPELRVALLFRQWDMPAKNYDLPFLGSDAQGYFVPESGSIPASDPVTSKAALVAVKMGARIQVTSEWDEDSAVAAEPEMSADLGEAIGRAIEDAIINGDILAGGASAMDFDLRPNTVAISTTAAGTPTLTTASNFFTQGVKPGDAITGGTPAPPAGTIVLSIQSATSLTMNNSITAGAEPQSRTFTRSTLIANAAEKGWDGLRKKALIANMPNRDLATFNDSTILPLWQDMAVFGAAPLPSDTAMIVGIRGFHKLVTASGQGAAVPPSCSFVTMDRIPGVAPLVGQVGMYAGRPVILSEFVREDVVGATAINDFSANNTTTFLLTVARRAYVHARRRGVTIQRVIGYSFDTDQIQYGGTWRGMFSELQATAAAANKTVGIGRNFS